jgi:uncharacterized protein YbjT (DUF2867 family)
MTQDRGFVAVSALYSTRSLNLLHLDNLGHQVTGANGTIGYACVVHALRAGYRVRCVVRRKSAIADIRRGPSLREYLGRDEQIGDLNGEAASRVEFAVVPDNTVPGAYDEALKGVRFVVHVAGVWPMPVSPALLCSQ